MIRKKVGAKERGKTRICMHVSLSEREEFRMLASELTRYRGETTLMSDLLKMLMKKAFSVKEKKGIDGFWEWLKEEEE
jgi:hypothetical protein